MACNGKLKSGEQLTTDIDQLEKAIGAKDADALTEWTEVFGCDKPKPGTVFVRLSRLAAGIFGRWSYHAASQESGRGFWASSS